MQTQITEERTRLTRQVVRMAAHPDWINLFNIKTPQSRHIIVAGSNENLSHVLREVGSYGPGTVLATPGEVGEFCLLELSTPHPEVSGAIGVTSSSTVKFLQVKASISIPMHLWVVEGSENYHFQIIDRGQRIEF